MSDLPPKLTEVPPKSSFRRWIFPIASMLPLILGILGVVFKGAGDEGGSDMAVAFFCFPASFFLGGAAAIVAWACGKRWSRLDKAIGFAPLVICVAIVIFMIASFVFNWNF